MTEGLEVINVQIVELAAEMLRFYDVDEELAQLLGEVLEVARHYVAQRGALDARV